MKNLHPRNKLDGEIILPQGKQTEVNEALSYTTLVSVPSHATLSIVRVCALQ